MPKDKFSINLLPASYTGLQKEYTKFLRVQTISIGIILFLVFLASLTVALGVFQNSQVKSAQATLDNFTSKVSDLKPKEASLAILKNRLSVIDQITSLPSKQRSLYNLVTQLTPPSLTILAVSIDSSGNMLLTILSPDYLSIDSLLVSLMSASKNEGRISQVLIDNLSRSRDGVYRGSLKIVAK